MATNCLAPAYLRIFYSANSHDHVLTIPVINSGTGADFEVERYDNSTVDQQTAVEELLDLVVPFFATTATFTGWEAYTQLNCESTPVFKNPGTLSSVDGTNVGAAAAWYQATLTFKTALGGRGRFQMMEGVFGVNQHLPIVGLGGIVEALADWLISDSSFVWARDNSRLVLPVNYTTKMNDTLRKKFLLDA